MKRAIGCSALTWVYVTGCDNKRDEPSGDCDETSTGTLAPDGADVSDADVSVLRAWHEPGAPE